MVNDSPQIRRVAIGYLYPNAVALDRADTLRFYDGLQTQHIALPELQQLPRELVLLRRDQIPTIYEVRVGAIDVAPAPGAPPQPGPFRLLVAELAPRGPFKLFQESADTVYSEFQAVWGGRVGRVQLVEVNFQAAFSVQDPAGAAHFIRTKFLGSASPAMANHLGRDYGMFGVNFGSPVTVVAGPGATAGPMPGAQVDFSVSPDMQARDVLVVALTAKWPSLQVRTGELHMPPAARQAFGGKDAIELNMDASEPAKYLAEVYKYVTENVVRFLKGLGA